MCYPNASLKFLIISFLSTQVTINAASTPPPPLPNSPQIILSCTDNLQDFKTHWSIQPSTVTPKVSSSSSSTWWYVEGQDPGQSQEIKLKLTNNNKKLVSSGGGGTWMLYIEYFNESPRRVLIDGVKNKNGGLYLLDGDTTSGWGSELIEMDGLEVTITTILKKPQKLNLRKIVLYKDTRVVVVNQQQQQKASSTTSLLSTTSCADLLKLNESPQQPSGSSSSIKQRPTPTTTKPPPPQHLLNQQKPSSSCRTKSTSTTSMIQNDDNDSSCPECKCVCNCNCSQCN